MRYAYDDLGRLSAVSAVLFHGQTLSSPSVTRYTYDRAGRTDLVTLPNGLTTDHDHDPLGRLVSLSVTRDDPATDAAERTPVASFGYELLGDGRRREVTERRFTPAGTLFSGTRVTYAFDRQGRLTEEDHLTTSAATGSALLAFRDGYTYDPAGNRLSKSHDANRDGDTSGPGDHTVAYDYDDHDDRLLTETRTPGSGGAPVTTAYFHDAAGNTTRVESGGTVTRYGYDLRGRQTETHRDADDTPEAATARDSRGGVVAETTGGVTTTHLLDYHNPTGYSQVLEQRTGSTLTRSFVLGPSVLAQADGQGGGGTAYLLRDAHSGVRFTTDAAGLMAEQYAYDAFGVPLGFDPASARSVHLFHGERFSPALGGSDVRGERVYESEKGRWRTADRYTPGVGDLSDRNRYAFVGADPVNGRDPSGMFSITELSVRLGVGFAVGAAVGAGDGYLRGERGLELADDAAVGGLFGMGGSAIMSMNSAYRAIRLLQASFMLVGTGFGAYGASDAANDGNYALAAYRGVFTVLGGVGFRASVRTLQLPQGFRSVREYNQFVAACYRRVHELGADDAAVAIRGSAVTGKSFRRGTPFDAESDIDIAIGSRVLLDRASALGFRTRGGGTRTAPLRDDDLNALGLEELSASLSKQLGRKVSMMVYRDAQDIIDRGAHWMVDEP